MRLIDADMLMKEIQSFRCSITGLRAGKGVLAHAADEYRKSILQIIDDQPTAFDRAKVIDELEDMKDIPHDDSVEEIISTQIWNKAIKKAIGIVDKSGLNWHFVKEGKT